MSKNKFKMTSDTVFLGQIYIDFRFINNASKLNSYGVIKQGIFIAIFSTFHQS